MNDLVRADSCSTRMMRTLSCAGMVLRSGAEMLTPLAIPLTGAAKPSVVLSLTALIVAGANVPHTSKKNYLSWAQIRG